MQRCYDISTSGNIVSSYVASDNTTGISDNGNDNSRVASGNSSSSNINSCKNDKNIAIDNASRGHGNNSSIIRNIACNTIPDGNVPTIVNDEMDISKVNDNMEDAARDLEEVLAPACPPLVSPSKARKARRSDRLQQSYIPRRLTRASTKS